MIYHETFAGPGVHYFKESEPFSLDEFYDFIRAVSDTHDMSLPNLHDFRDVDLARIDSPALRRFLMRLTSLLPGPRENHAAFVVTDMTGMAMLRLYTVLADISRMRDENLTLVTTEMDEAIVWLCDEAGLGPPGRLAALVAEAERQAALQRKG